MWARIVTLIAGIWLMAAPELLGFSKSTATNGQIVGPLIATFSIIAMAEATRNAQWLNLPLGAWLIFAPVVLGYDSDTAFWSDFVAGITCVVLSIVKMKRKNRVGGGWAALFSR